MSIPTLEWIRFLHGDPLNAFSSLLRSTIVASPGKILDVADFSQIEVRVCFWLAGHQRGLDAFIEGRDLYIEQAEAIYSVKPGTFNKVDHARERFLGKEAILGCQYMMGPPRFQGSCADKGILISDELSKKSVYSYREKHKPITVMWANVYQAAVSAVQNPTRRFTVNKTTWYMSGDFLKCRLPSGRDLHYHKPEVRYELDPWKNKKPVLYYYGIHPKKRKWLLSSCHAGTLVENITQATARDVMAEAMLRVRRAKHWDILLSVHDELISERTVFGEGSHAEYQRLISVVPDWAAGLPIKCEGFEDVRYRK